MANFEEVGFLIRQCCSYFEHREPKAESLNQWAEQLQYLDAIHFPEVVKRFSAIDGWPKNFPGKIKEFYHIVSKGGKVWSVEEFVLAYYRDHGEEINREASRLGVDAMDIAWAEMSRPLVRKGNMNKGKAVWYWNKAKKGALPDYLRGLDDSAMGKDVNSFRRSFGRTPYQEEQVPF